MLKVRLPKAALILSCLLALVSTAGCNRSPAGTPENLKADYDRVVKERDDLKTDFEKQKTEIEGIWQQRVTDQEQKVADLTSENASLRQRLLVADAAGQDVPLTDAAHARSVTWLHVIYALVIAACMVLVAIVMWAHINLREQMRQYLVQQANFISMKGVSHVE